MKRWFKVSSQLKVGLSGKVKVSDALPVYSDPAVEFRHKIGSSHGSSIILTPHSVALAHVHRISRAGNLWLSGFINFSFLRERLTPKQLSTSLRFHPSGSEALEDTVVTASFDAPEVDEDLHFLRHGMITVSAITQWRKHLYSGVQLSNKTGSGKLTSTGFNNGDIFHPVAQLGLIYKYGTSTANVATLIDCKRPKEGSDIRIRVEHFFEDFKLNAVAAATYVPRTNRASWSIGAYAQLDDILPL